jgi:hypothetical protein
MSWIIVSKVSSFDYFWGTLKGRANMGTVHFLHELQHCLRISWDIARRALSCVEEYFWNVPGLLRSLNSTFLSNKFKLNCKGKTCPEFQAVTGFPCDNLSISTVIYKDRISKYFSVCVFVCMCKSLKYTFVKEWW